MQTVVVDITPEVQSVLEAAQFDGEGMVFVGQLERKLYEACMKVVEKIGGKWNRSARAILFAGQDAADVVRQALDAGSIVDKKKTFHFFETPQPVAESMMHLAQIGHGDLHVLEPSAGKGALAREIIDWGSSTLQLDVCEIQADLVCGLADAGYTIVGRDFLNLTGFTYDRIIANPPFKAEVEHVNHMFELLAPDGRIVTVMSNAIKHREQKKYASLRTLIEENGEIVDLPGDAFKASGTGVQAVVVVIDKPS